MIKNCLKWLFGYNTAEVVGQLKKNPAFKRVDQLSQSDANTNVYALEKGTIEIISVPDLGLKGSYRLAKWHVNPGQMVAPGMILGEIENDKVTMEFESFCSGRLLSHCGLKQDLQVGDEICKIEGV